MDANTTMAEEIKDGSDAEVDPQNTIPNDDKDNLYVFLKKAKFLDVFNILNCE